MANIIKQLEKMHDDLEKIIYPIWRTNMTKAHTPQAHPWLQYSLQEAQRYIKDSIKRLKAIK